MNFNHLWLRIRQNSCVTEFIKKQRPYIDRIYLLLKDSLESKHQSLISVGEKLGNKKLQNPKGFIGYSQTFDDIYENL